VGPHGDGPLSGAKRVHDDADPRTAAERARGIGVTISAYSKAGILRIGWHEIGWPVSGLLACVAAALWVIWRGISV